MEWFEPEIMGRMFTTLIHLLLLRSLRKSSFWVCKKSLNECLLFTVYSQLFGLSLISPKLKDEVLSTKEFEIKIGSL